MTTITDKATKAVSHLDSSRAARLAGDIGSAESALDAALAILLELAGVTPIQWVDGRQPTLATLPIEHQVLTQRELLYVGKGDRVGAIKAIRERTKMSLSDCRDLLDRASPRAR